MTEYLDRFKSKGIMGLNERNVSLVNALNARHHMKLVDDKALTKLLAAEAGIPTPKLYGIASSTRECRKIASYIDPVHGAAIKPACGTQGKGIMIVNGRVDERNWCVGHGRTRSDDDLMYHAINLTSGMYSLAGRPDSVLVEERIVFDDVFSNVTYKGVPDIRIIVLKGIPIAAMLRLPTSKSDGKANLHQGGVGAGVDLITGRTMSAMLHSKTVSHHPDTNASLVGLEVPHWSDILDIASRAYDATRLGYLGVDIVLDRNQGPLLLELNARPGLSIQIAMGRGLRQLVQPVMEMETAQMTVADRIETCYELAARPAPVIPVKTRPTKEPKPILPWATARKPGLLPTG